ncbi:hypothetical protein Vretimale_18691, partial [Volvox reticuliferus]
MYHQTTTLHHAGGAAGDSVDKQPATNGEALFTARVLYLASNVCGASSSPRLLRPITAAADRGRCDRISGICMSTWLSMSYTRGPRHTSLLLFLFTALDLRSADGRVCSGRCADIRDLQSGSPSAAPSVMWPAPAPS